MKEEIAAVRGELEKIKELHLSQSTKTDCLQKEGEEDMGFDDEQLFDLPSIRRTINTLQERVKQISLNSSAFLDSSQLLRQSRIKDDFINQRISLQVVKIEEAVACQHERLQQLVNKKIEKQQKTISNILQTLNELQPAQKPDKNTPTIASSKSAARLKSILGFG